MRNIVLMLGLVFGGSVFAQDPPLELSSERKVAVGELAALGVTNLLTMSFAAAKTHLPLIVLYENKKLTILVMGERDKIEDAKKTLGEIPLADVAAFISAGYHVTIDTEKDITLIYRHGKKEIVRRVNGLYVSQ